MNIPTKINTSSSFVFVIVAASLGLSLAAHFEVTNHCPYTIWAAASPGGGRRLDRRQTWGLDVPEGTAPGRIWGRTNCLFNAAGRGHCETGDCGGLLECRGYGAAPNTLVEYSINQFSNLDFLDLSVMDGFNVPIEFRSTSGTCNRVIRCAGNIHGDCPDELRVPGGCHGACPMFKTAQYCCNSGSCGPTDYSRFFKDRCPQAYSYPFDDASSLFTCPGGTNYKVVFCP